MILDRCGISGVFLLRVDGFNDLVVEDFGLLYESLGLAGHVGKSLEDLCEVDLHLFLEEGLLLKLELCVPAVEGLGASRGSLNFLIRALLGDIHFVYRFCGRIVNLG
jgi:hypothetical protein